MSKFAALAVNVVDSFNMQIISPRDEMVLKDAAGREAFISFLSNDSEAGRKLDRAYQLAQARKKRNGRNAEDDEDYIKLLVERLAALTTGWYLVDLDGNAIDVPFSPENAKELWSDPAMSWLRTQAAVFVNNAGNFMPRSSKS
jgi:hypothetical protein